MRSRSIGAVEHENAVVGERILRRDRPGMKPAPLGTQRFQRPGRVGDKLSQGLLVGRMANASRHMRAPAKAQRGSSPGGSFAPGSPRRSPCEPLPESAGQLGHLLASFASLLAEFVKYANETQEEWAVKRCFVGHQISGRGFQLRGARLLPSASKCKPGRLPLSAWASGVELPNCCPREIAA
jgi:hypothetical protein